MHEHHIVPVSQGGPDVDENLGTLCRRCHTLVHAGLIRIEGTPSTGLRFVDQQGRDLHGAEPPPAEAVGAVAALAALEGTAARLLEMPQPEPNGALRHLRPSRPAFPLADVVGQTDVVEALKEAVRVANECDEPMGHTLLAGPPGLGKTTLAVAVAAELAVEIETAAAPMLQYPADLAPILARVGRRDILFIDEIHALPRTRSPSRSSGQRPRPGRCPSRS